MFHYETRRIQQFELGNAAEGYVRKVPSVVIDANREYSTTKYAKSVHIFVSQDKRIGQVPIASAT